QRNAAWADVARRVAHEIKNPLTPIQLSAERLKKKYLKFITEDAENYTRYLDTITKHVGDIGKMVEEFVAFARMPTARFVTEDLAGIVRKSVFSSQVAFPAMDVVADVPAAPVPFKCDERQITQILTNLVKNAAESIEARPDASDKGVIRVTLAQSPDAITLSVQDNGVGFPTEEASKMLEPYVTTRAKGMGLGLAIVKKIVDDHNGLLSMENNPDCGAKVTLSFMQQCDINAA
ncbi:MAG: ATP-binding protein, partial [Alphaproteobacteria bacterium]|nr:ATP-binding protein [Alphaproteobacteria bacterium]